MLTFTENETTKTVIMKAITRLTINLLILIFLYSCNNDVFIDDFRTSNCNINLDGNGDDVTVPFASSNWNLMGIFPETNSAAHQYEIYDADGNLIKKDRDVYLKGLGKVVCNEKLNHFIIQRSNPKELKIIVDENLNHDIFNLRLVVGNENESQDIYVTITPSDRYVLDHITYSLTDYFHEKRLEEIYSITIQNNSNDSITFHVKPFNNVYHKVTFKNDNPEDWLIVKENDLNIEIPSFENERLAMKGLQAHYTHNTQSLALPFPNTKEVKISIPPNTTQKTTLFADYEYFETKYTLYVVNPKNGKKRTLTGTLQSMMPTEKIYKGINIVND